MIPFLLSIVALVLVAVAVYSAVQHYQKTLAENAQLKKELEKYQQPSRSGKNRFQKKMEEMMTRNAFKLLKDQAHADNCCVNHGCYWGQNQCPVVLGEVNQTNECGDISVCAPSF